MRDCCDQREWNTKKICSGCCREKRDKAPGGGGRVEQVDYTGHGYLPFLAQCPPFFFTSLNRAPSRNVVSPLWRVVSSLNRN